MLHTWLKSIQNDLYPHACVLCGRATGTERELCCACERDLPWNRDACRQCAAPLAEAGASQLCGQCLRQPPVWQSAASPLRYAWPLDQLIKQFKFHADLATGSLLGHLLATFLAAVGGVPPDYLIPVPLHPARLRARGFNQALELAHPVSRRLRIPLGLGVCRRIRPTEVQSRLDAAARRRNLQGAFEVIHPVSGLNLAILDDVVTTGATVSALAQTLLAADAARVQVWSLARAAA